MNGVEVLQKISSIQIDKWRYKSDGVADYISPYAEDFYELFHLGEDNKGLCNLNTSGVALLGLQGAYDLILQLQERIKILEKR